MGDSETIRKQTARDRGRKGGREGGEGGEVDEVIMVKRSSLQ